MITVCPEALFEPFRTQQIYQASSYYIGSRDRSNLGIYIYSSFCHWAKRLILLNVAAEMVYWKGSLSDGRSFTHDRQLHHWIICFTPESLLWTSDSNVSILFMCYTVLSNQRSRTVVMAATVSMQHLGDSRNILRRYQLGLLIPGKTDLVSKI